VAASVSADSDPPQAMPMAGQPSASAAVQPSLIEDTPSPAPEVPVTIDSVLRNYWDDAPPAVKSKVEAWYKLEEKFRLIVITEYFLKHCPELLKQCKEIEKRDSVIQSVFEATVRELFCDKSLQTAST
jgi:hypothetical protein